MSMLKDRLIQTIHGLIDQLKNEQSPDGSWSYPFETGISTDAYMIILLRTLEINEEDLIKSLVARLMQKQEENGAWKLYADEENGNLTCTIEAYYALLYSGYYDEQEEQLKKAKQYILENGGMKKAHLLAKIMLAMTGQYDWPAFFPLPVEIVLLPQSFPISFFSFSVYGRANLTPIMILADKKFQLLTKRSPDLSSLLVETERSEDDFFGYNRSREWRKLCSIIQQGITRLIGLPHQLHQQAVDEAKLYMLARIEEDGTFYSYFSSTFLMIFALLALGHDKQDPIIANAVSGLIAMKTEISGHTHMQYTTANVWNTSLISYTLQEAGVSSLDPMVTKANNYLQVRQHHKLADWAIHTPNVQPGGWGFSHINTINPDVDDSTAALRSIARRVKQETLLRNAWDRGVTWVLAMQNLDGGWPSFERNTDSVWLKLLPIESGEFILADASSVDLTGRTLEFLGNYTKMQLNDVKIKNGIEWLLHEQEKDGSWYGRWGICYLYGTWSAVTGLMAVGVPSSHFSIKRAIRWLASIQNKDGGWGESCKSDRLKKYTPLGVSTLTHTAWAVDALIATADSPTKSIEKGIKYLIANINKDDWTTDYPHGQGMVGGFYIHYHSYRYIFPLLALAHYQRKFCTHTNKPPFH
jgi:sporulenol synthase